jgi:hypothetical protein
MYIPQEYAAYHKSLLKAEMAGLKKNSVEAAVPKEEEARPQGWPQVQDSKG